MTRRLAFFAIAACAASSLVHCGSSGVKPPLATDSADDSGTTAPPTTKDAGTDVTMTSTVDASDANTGTPSGPPSAMTLVPSSVSFGSVNCGTSASPSTVQVINNSSEPVSLGFYFEQNKGAFSASFQNPATGASFGASVPSLAVSSAVSLVITPAAVPTTPNTANTASGYADTLQLVVNGGSNTANAIPVKESAEGVTFAFSSSNVAFGDVPVNTTTSQNVRVTNNGSEAANFALVVGDGGASPFTVTQPTAALAPGATTTLPATFAPTTAGAANTLLALVQEDGTPLCGPLPTPLALAGNGVTGNVGVSPGALTFGDVQCGTTAPGQGVYLSNVNGTAPYTWHATVAPIATNGPVYYTVSLATGTILAGATSGQDEDGGAPTFTVVPNTIPNVASVAADAYANNLVITTNIPGDTPHTVSLAMTAAGAVVTTTPTSLTSLTFPSWAVGQTETLLLNLNNTGNETASLNLIATAPYGAPATVVLDAGSNASVPITFNPTAAQSFPGTLSVTGATGTAFCATLPGGSTGIALAGTGVTPVAPSFSLSSSSINFGLVPCGATTTLPITIAVQNTGTTGFYVSASLQNGAGSLFGATVVPTSADGGTLVGAGSETNVTVSLPAMPQAASITPNAYADVLQLLLKTTDGAVKTTNVPVAITASGAIMAFQPSGLDFGTVVVNSTTNLPFTVVNSGNLAAEVDLEFQASGGADSGSVSQFGRSPLGLVDVNASASASLQASFAAADTNAQSGALTMTPSSKPANHFCAPMPSPLVLTGQGSSSTTVVTPASIDFGLTNCGTQAGQAPVTIQNTASTGSVAWSAKFLSGGSYYTLSASSGTVNALSSGTFNVIPSLVPATSPITPDYYAATLQVTSGTNNQTQLVNIHQTAQGVILTSTGNGASNFSSLAFGGVSVNQTATTQFTITNSGNVAINDVQLSNTNTVFAVNPLDSVLDGGPPPSAQLLAFSLAPSQSIEPEVTFTPAGVGNANDTAVYTLPTGTVLCAPAPPSFTLSGTGNTGIAVSPTSLNFGLVQCSSAPPAGQQVTISNKGSAATWTGTFGRGVQNLPSYYALQDAFGNTITAGATQTLPAGSVTTIYVIPVKISVPASTSPNAFSDTLTITTTATGDSPHVVSLAETAQGAFLSFNPLTMGGAPGLASSQTGGFTITNSGNLAASFYLNVTMTQGNDTSITYPYTLTQTCQAYSVSSPFPNECAPPGCTGKDGTYAIALPEFCTNIGYTASAPGSLYAGQNLSGEVEFTGYPNNESFSQALGSIQVVPVNTVLCSLPVPVVPLSEPSYSP